MSHENLDYVAAMRKNGYRVTSQRLTVLDAVCDVGGHATMGQIYQRVKELDPAIDQSTVYRALDVLCEVGLVNAAEIGSEGKVYEIAEKTPHHHLVCQQCGTIFSLEHQFVKPLLKRIKQQTGFVVTDNHLTLTGICASCSQMNTSSVP